MVHETQAQPVLVRWRQMWDLAWHMCMRACVWVCITGGELYEVGRKPRPFQLFIVQHFHDLCHVLVGLDSQRRQQPQDISSRLSCHCHSHLMLSSQLNINRLHPIQAPLSKTAHHTCKIKWSWVEQGLTSHQTHYRSYRGQDLWVKRPNQQCQSTEGREVLMTRLQSH